MIISFFVCKTELNCNSGDKLYDIRYFHIFISAKAKLVASPLGIFIFIFKATRSRDHHSLASICSRKLPSIIFQPKNLPAKKNAPPDQITPQALSTGKEIPLIDFAPSLHRNIIAFAISLVPIVGS